MYFGRPYKRLRTVAGTTRRIPAYTRLPIQRGEKQAHCYKIIFIL